MNEYGIDDEELAEILNMNVFRHKLVTLPTLTLKEWDELNEMIQSMSDPADPEARIMDVGQHYDLYLLLTGSFKLKLPRDISAQNLWNYAWDLLMYNLGVKQGK